MKKSSFLLVLPMSMLSITIASAQNTVTTPVNDNQPTSLATPNSACVKVRAACEAAGYVLNGQPGKNLLSNCIQPVLMKQTVPNLNVTPQILDACQTEVNNLPCNTIMQACHASGFTGGPGKLPMFDCLFPIYRGAKITGVNPTPAELSSCKAFLSQALEKQPCLRVLLACRDAGYSPDATVNGQVFARNCFVPVTSGKKVPGVVIDPETAAACSIDMKTIGPNPSPLPQSP